MITSLDYKIIVWERALSPAECERWIAHFTWNKHGVVHRPDLAAELVEALTPRMPRCPKLEWLEHVTISSHITPWHLDAKIDGATHKLCVYLDDTNVGTEFRHSFDWKGPWRGAICLFDIDLEHRTAEGIGTTPRRVLGLRAKAVSG